MDDEFLVDEDIVSECKEEPIDEPALKPKKRAKKSTPKQPTGKMIYLNGRALEIIE